MAIEEIKYTVISTANEFEIRDYDSHILAESIMVGDFDDAGDRAFNRLFWFISGDNLPSAKLERPLQLQQKLNYQKIKMISPIELQDGHGSWAVRFMMPASYTLDSLPQPADFGITVREVPAQRMAVVRYSSFWSEKAYLKNKTTLESWIDGEGLTTLGEPIWARYSEPFMPWFMKRNEVLIPIDLATSSKQY